MKQEEQLPEAFLFTDGGCGKPGNPGGWAFLLRQPTVDLNVAYCGYVASTTNNRMELQAVIEGLKQLKERSHVTLVSDSQYVIGGITSWLAKWKTLGWKTGVGINSVKNIDMWVELDKLLQQHVVKCRHTRGHIGHPENEFCDHWASEIREIGAEMFEITDFTSLKGL